MDSRSNTINNQKLLSARQPRVAVPSQSDYLPWQRTAREASRQSGSSSSAKSGSTTQSRPVTAATIGSACSSKCRHSWKYLVTSVNNEDETKEKNLLSILQMQVKMREKSISDYKRRFEELLKENIRLKEEITSIEEHTHRETKSLLQRYEKFRGAVGTLHKQYDTELMVCRKDLEETKQKCFKDIKVYQAQVDELNEKLLTKNSEVKTFLNYKDKEYPGKMLRITKLEREREVLLTEQKEELEELRNSMEADRLRTAAEEESIHKDVRYRVNEDVVSSMDVNMKEMALQNMIMSKEVEIHKSEILLLEDHNSKLEEEIRAILGDRKLNPGGQLFPDIFRLNEKCSPQDEIHLDIPLKRWLPI